MHQKRTHHLLIVAGLAIPHALLLWSIAGDMKDFFLGVPPDSLLRVFKDLLYFVTYCLFPGIGCLVVISLIKKRWLAHTASIVYVLSYFSFVLFVMIYRNYAGVFPPLKAIANPQEVTSVIEQILIQFTGIREWTIFFLMFPALYVCWKIVQQDNPPFRWQSKKTIGWLAFFFLLNLKGPIQLTRQPKVAPTSQQKRVRPTP